MNKMAKLKPTQVCRWIVEIENALHKDAQSIATKLILNTVTLNFTFLPKK